MLAADTAFNGATIANGGLASGSAGTQRPTLLGTVVLNADGTVHLHADPSTYTGGVDSFTYTRQ